MKLVAEKLGRTDKADRLRFVRADGTQTQAAMPRQGTLPHDLVHFVVESALRFERGFLGLIAAGAEAGFVMQAVHDKANTTPGVEAVQAEAVVEALQTQLWAGAFDADAFLDGVASASAARGQPPFAFSGSVAPVSLFEDAQALLERWNGVPFHASLELDFGGDHRRT
jgi:hypothetical protein